ncbi:AGE family epimerase/isomerase [Saccharopolyspora erythraea]|uniref:AGE family epimerase/isomerase n=1 Tax=Saccharopolyspora erythraea TaxID=1836 RepID=UPI0020112908|nr:AGE family epimerase/isomerase [Saccharopolyspora erythraea]
MAAVDFTFSDTVAGYVVHSGDSWARLNTVDGRAVTVRFTSRTHARLLRNLGEPYSDVTERIAELLVPGQLVFSYGPVYPEPDGLRFHCAQLTFVGECPTRPVHEHPRWWVEQLTQLAAFYREAQFGSGPPDFTGYRTDLGLSGAKAGRRVQETDTISRLVYGMAASYLLTGDEDALEVAERGSAYMQDNLRFADDDEQVTYWYHGVELDGVRERKLFASEFGDEEQALPAYEQIYALAGPVHTYRVTGDPSLRADIEGTVRLFERFYADPQYGGYFSHLDPLELSPRARSLGRNRSRKNWNSIGDHAPAYLFNLYLATGQERYLRMLESTFDLVVSHFPADRDLAGEPFVRERFHRDWTPDLEWGWQQNGAVVGHNLKIAWNLARMHSLVPKHDYRALAELIASRMPDVGRDPQRGGWYDVVDRAAEDGRHRFAWHDRKTWWQQEQAILAYLLLAGTTGAAEYARHAREASAFYNAFFLDHDDGAVYFAVLSGGLPYLLGTERGKGSHSMSMYHAAELCYLATVYTRLLVRREPLELWFRPRPDADFPGRVLRVAPDALPPGQVVLDQVHLDGEPSDDFDPVAMTVPLPDSEHPVRVRVRLRPTVEEGR